MQTLDWWMVAAFFAVLVAIPVFASRRNRGTSKDFLLAGRSMPWWLIGLSMTAACTSTDSMNLFTEIIRRDGLAGNWVWWAFLITSVLTVFVYSRLWVRTGVTTDVEFYELRYSGKPAVFLRALRGVYLGVILNLLVMGAVVLGGLKIGVILFGCSSTTILVFTGVFSIVYVAFAGMRGAIYTDFYLFLVILVGSFAAMFYALGLPEVGGLAGLAAHPALEGKLSLLPDLDNTDAVFACLVIPLAVQWWGVWKQGAEPGGGGYIVQRILSAKSEGHAVAGTLFFNLVHYAIRPWPWYIVGFCSLIVFPRLSDIQRAFPSVDPALIGGDMAYPAMLTKVPSGWFGVVAASMMAALFSTVAAHLTMGSSYVVNDFYRRFVRPRASGRELIWVARLTMVVFMALACLLAPLLTSAKTAFDLMLLIGAGSGPIFLLRWFWMRINAWSEIVGILAALLTAVVLELVLPNCGVAAIASWKKLLYGVAVTTVAWLVATFVTRPEPEDVRRRFKAIVRADGRDAGRGVLLTFLVSVGIFATMFAICQAIRCPAARPVRPVPDALVAARESDVKVGGHVGAVQDRFFRERIVSDFARKEIWKEARDAFAHPDDDVFNKGIGMWKGEFWGKLMISACRAAVYLKDPDLREFLHQEALRLIAFQQPDGYLGSYVDKEYVVPLPLEEQTRRMGWKCSWNWNLWCRKYTLWGLLCAYFLTGDRQILDAADRAMTQQIDMLKRRNLKLCDTGTACMHGLPPCSVLKPLLWLYQATGRPKYLDYAREIVGYSDDPTCQAVQFRAKLATGLPMEAWYPEENGQWGKAYEMMSCLAGFVEYYRVTGDREILAVVARMRDRILADELNLCCSVGYNDQFWGARLRLNGVSEPCDAVHWMRLNHDLYLVTGEARYADEIERCFYNAFLAAVRPDGRWGARCVRSHGRHEPAGGQSGMKLQHCCVNNLPRGFMDAACSILAQDEKGTLQVGLYHDSEASVGVGSVKITGGYPVRNEVTVAVDRRTAGKVRFRVPEWCPSLEISGNGRRERAEKPGWFEVEAPAGRSTWLLTFEMRPRIVLSQRASVAEYGAHDPLRNRWANPTSERDLFALLRTTPAAQVFYGPLLLAKSVRLGADEETLLDAETVNGGGWRVTAQPIPCADVWGAWTLEFEKDGVKKSVPACDYSSAALWKTNGVEFSVFF